MDFEGNASKFNRIGLDTKLRILLEAFEQAGIKTSPDWCYKIDSTDSKFFTNLFADKKFDLKNGSEIIYYPNTNSVPALYRYCFDNDIKPGKILECSAMPAG